MHDAKGNLLQIGDKVLIPATIKDIQAGEEYCNCTVELEYSMPPKEYKDSMTINTKQCIKVEE